MTYIVIGLDHHQIYVAAAAHVIEDSSSDGLPHQLLGVLLLHVWFPTVHNKINNFIFIITIVYLVSSTDMAASVPDPMVQNGTLDVEP